MSVCLAVRFRGYVPPAELPGFYAQADVAALVSTYEPFGVTMREAAAAGLPLVCSRAAGAAGDVAVEDENALLVNPHDRGQVDQFQAGALTFSIANEGAGYSVDNFTVPPELQAELDKVLGQIKSGALTPPADIPA